MSKKKLPTGVIRLSLGKNWCGTERFAIVDSKFIQELQKYRWHAAHQHGNVWYGVTYIDGERTYLHHLVMSLAGNLPPTLGLMVDHVNGDGLDCREANMRWATPRQNSLNKATLGVSGFYGVTPTKSGRFQWYAMGKVRGNCVTAAEAAKKRDAFLRENLAADDLPFPRMNYDLQGKRVDYSWFDHGPLEHEPRAKSVPDFVGVSEVKNKKGDRVIGYLPSLMVNRVKLPFPVHRDLIQALRTLEETRELHGLPRIVFKGYAPVVVALGVGYAVTTG